MIAVTRDALFGGALPFWQPARGYRVNVDSLLLATFAHGQRARHVVDLGAGVGAVTLSLAHLGPVARASAVERDPAIAALCEKNFAEHGLDAQVLVADLATGLPRSLRQSADLVLCNPPFFEPGERRPASAGRESARAGALAPFLRAARIALGRGGGRVVFVYPARSLERFLHAAEAAALSAKRLRFVHPFLERPARVALVELKAAKPGGLVIEPPLVEWQKRGVASEELSRWLSPGRSATGRT